MKVLIGWWLYLTLAEGFVYLLWGPWDKPVFFLGYGMQVAAFAVALIKVRFHHRAAWEQITGRHKQ